MAEKPCAGVAQLLDGIDLTVSKVVPIRNSEFSEDFERLASQQVKTELSQRLGFLRTCNVSEQSIKQVSHMLQAAYFLGRADECRSRM
jgi:hypothetical protein